MSKKNKLRLSYLAPRPYRLNLIHPEHGDTGAYVDLVTAQSTSYFLKAIQLSKLSDDASTEEQIASAAELAATVVTGWDEDFFEAEFNTDAVVTLLKSVENFWVRDAINEALGEKSNFFTKA